MNTKKCNECNIEKPLSEFRLKKDKNGKYYYYYICKDCNKVYNTEYAKKYRKKNKEKINEYKRKYDKEYYQKNNLKEKKRLYKQKNRDDFIKYKKQYYNNKLKNNIENQIKNRLRVRIYNVLNGTRKSNTINKLIGCSIIELKNYLGIIDNYDSSKYHIDHIIPCAAYDLSKESEQLKCFNYRNLRLCRYDKNISKHNKIDFNLIKFYNIENLLPKNL